MSSAPSGSPARTLPTTRHAAHVSPVSPRTSITRVTGTPSATAHTFGGEDLRGRAPRSAADGEEFLEPTERDVVAAPCESDPLLKPCDHLPVRTPPAHRLPVAPSF